MLMHNLYGLPRFISMNPLIQRSSRMIFHPNSNQIFIYNHTTYRFYRNQFLNPHHSAFVPYDNDDDNRRREKRLKIQSNHLMIINRHLYINRPLYDLKDSSKVEQTVKALRESKVKEPQKAVQIEPKRSLGKRIWDEIVHYYHGFRLLIIDIGIASRLIWKILNGNSLSRREYRQLVRTSSDVFRLAPFSVFIIIPFMELLLPVFLKFFPNMLPSTFQTASSREVKVKQELKLKLDMAKFLQTTLDEMTLQARGESHSNRAKEFKQFFDNIRKSGEQASNDDILRFSKLFEDEITLDSLSRPQLVALCRLLELQPIGTSNFLLFQLRMRLRSLKADDQMIAREGIESLTVSELQQACRSRGMRALGISEDRLRFQLSQWLELSLNEKIPNSLLLLSRVLYLPENIPATDQLKATIQALPEGVGTETRYKIGETEGKIDNRTKIELLKQEEEAIKRENEEERLKKQVEPAIEKEMIKEQVIDKIFETVSGGSSGEPPKVEPVLSKEDIESIETALENLAKEKKVLMLEKEELDEIKEELDDYKEDLIEFKDIAQQTGDIIRLKESKAARRLRKRMDKMVGKMDKVFDSLESKKKKLETAINQLEKEGKDIDQVKKDVVSINELLQTIRPFTDVSDDTKSKRILEVLDNLDINHDGLIELEHVFKVIELIGRENVQLTPKQIKEIIKLLIQEEQLNIEEKKKKQLKNDTNIESSTVPPPPQQQQQSQQMKSNEKSSF
ncbi:letm1 and ef-hand domain-containing protein anon-60da [Dermatophagoides farinae]|uniref:Mitochondrial proton/calcium exchanger protein n=1 Tax=Dermatophagoides farinae TaxID=6954 RepID=A0A9D4SH57_DERFA|nr:mitochondrial proton/calcium exchanger protein-like [Dermatophagoides farinae]KAH7641466.1 letm1 and ef-hand domain-containing protein anon-60da [Dermatophagoides farinae]